MGEPSSNTFIDQSETIVSTIGSSYLQNFLSGGSVEKGVGVLTQNRFYYKGRNFSGSGKATKSITEEGVVSIEDITFTRFTYARPIGFLIVAILVTIVGGIAVLGIGALASIPFYIKYFISRQTLFQICFHGGDFSFDIRWYPIADILDFQRQLHLLKDHRREA